METLTDGERLSAFARELIEQATAFGISLVSAIVILISGYIIAGWAYRTVRNRLQQAEQFDATLIPVLAQVARYAILGFTLVLVLAQFGVQTASLIAVIGAAGLAIGLALQGTLQNVAAGLMLLILRPFQVGDWIEAAGHSGTAEEIGLFMTKLRDFEGLFIAVPNSKIWADTIVNHTRNPHRRLVLTAGISYDDDIDQARDVLRRMVEADARVQSEPDPPVVLVASYGESAVDLQIRAWTRNEDYWPLRFDMTRAIKYALDDARITIPYPHRHVIITANGEQRIQPGESKAAAPERAARKPAAKPSAVSAKTKTRGNASSKTKARTSSRSATKSS